MSTHVSKLLATVLVAVAIVTLLILVRMAFSMTQSTPSATTKHNSDQQVLPLELQDTAHWQTYSTDVVRFKYPKSLVILKNPRSIPNSEEQLYVLLDAETAAEYLECLEVGKQQVLEHERNGTFPDEWVDWEGACDIKRVVFIITPRFFTKVPQTDSYMSALTDSYNRTWQLHGNVGMGDYIGITAISDDIQNFAFSLSSHERVLHTYLNIQATLDDGATHPEYNSYLIEFLRLMLSSVQLQP